ncbi:hypothetical protein AG1IA_04194 [Rhizoctonia solani AG-1 IA]|uniref:Uncharacterized protein n=1 Tax=Thanatephorus cucumeris (strain AG1-IA) TaxID=983506 RepID=L8WUH5_THACA|nr:hypothetical protein AG1IA_04194 [Rhizoctonia solani AG-1 IA]
MSHLWRLSALSSYSINSFVMQEALARDAEVCDEACDEPQGGYNEGAYGSKPWIPP